ncbi:sulfate reduction electron transfer complex DsrMKJOP subunit DsrP [Neomoorella mulderi]|uniref:Polysulfide reductase, NrfD n=1 Tax=Moorella mulderi DSM 14980 TaxID=1122241 RepID=A0A151AXW4_9FIRM|nr:NrfD/PsrC family molybdoenzyme membrane anchor subunit [Moorella mulderi]KYH32410.1 polysulfide reductase, NrfD [Moorella mulderi DSM 14980]
MLVKALTGSKKYWGWTIFLLVLIATGFACYLWQLQKGLTITGMSRDVSWGLYISQFTFLVGVAASAVMVVLPYYLHNVKAFGRITILGEFLAIAALIMCLLFVIVDVGKPMRILNMIFYPTPNSMFFWDMIALNGYLLLNIIAGWHALEAEYKAVPPPAWTKILVYISIPWAVSIHTVTAFLYAGLPGRHYWLTAIMAARFLASAFASGPALLIILSYIIKRVSKFDPGREAIQKLAAIVTYATIISVFFVGLEFFTAFYSQVPAHGLDTLKYLFAGLDGHGKLVPWMWTFAILAVLALVLLINPRTRTRDTYLQAACVAVFVSMWIEKGIGLVIGGFIPNPFERVTEYVPTLPETLIALGVWATGFLILTFLYKIAIAVKEETV